MIKIISFAKDHYNEYVIKTTKKINGTTFVYNEKNLFYYTELGILQKISLNEIFEINQNKYLAIPYIFYDYKFDNIITINQNGDIKLKNIDIEISNNNKLLNKSKNIYVNGILQTDEIINLEIGDNIIIDKYFLIYHNNYIASLGCEILETTLINTNVKTIPHIDFEKSPRKLKNFQTSKISIKAPEINDQMPKKTLVKILVPPIISILTTLLMAYFTKRGIIVLIGLITTISSLIFSIVAFYQEKKEMILNKNKEIKVYEEKLLETRKQLFSLYNNEISVYNYNFPHAHEIKEMLENGSTRLYERDIKDSDFLDISLGYHNVSPHYSISLENFDNCNNKNPLVQEARAVYNNFNMIRQVQKTINLRSQHIGLIGNKEAIHQELKRIILELSFFHSYHDVVIITQYDFKYANKFKFCDWLPHCKLQMQNLTTNISSDLVKDQTLRTLYQILRQRQIEVRENKGNLNFSPYLIFIIDDYRSISNHPIMEYLLGDDDLGFSLIISGNEFGDIPAVVKNILTLYNINKGNLILENGINTNQILALDNTHTLDYEEYSRNISLYNHKIGITNNIPDKVEFLEMYDVKKVEDLNIGNLWDKANIHKTIAVPIGYRAKNDIVYLNLHEKAHGPHGLVAGTTGSGKSEILQTYILSLAINFSPYEVGFLLIDFKGGGMANLFKSLPHLIGTITNLDGSESMRALASIKAELARRQTIFNENDVNNINLYNAKFKQGEVSEPLPHLFIISDEFAELKKEQPEFMSELVSVARIGRTLGVHLILATQKPSGVVNDQIWSNSKFKLALKVQDEADSKEILKTPDAAYITKTGRAYLQVGNNEIYELFQSAWSGADYVLEESLEEIDQRVYKVNKLRQEELINTDLSYGEKSSKTITQLDAVISEIEKVYNNKKMLPVKKAWLPSLEKQIINPNLVDYIIKDLSTISNVDLCIKLGLVDIPDKQQQLEYEIDFAKASNLLIYGSGGFGKSFTIGNCILDLAIKNNPALLNFFIIDLGNSGLINYANLPHVADYLTLDDNIKLTRLMNKIIRISKERKKLLNEEKAQSIELYEQKTNSKLPRIIIIIDNIDAMKEINEGFLMFLEKAARDSQALGIYFIVSAHRYNSLRQTVTNNFKNKICHYLLEESEMRTIIGRHEYPINSSQLGRALVKIDNVYQMQNYIFTKFEDLNEYNEKLESFINNINNAFTGSKPDPIPVIPETLSNKDIINYETDRNYQINLGLTVSDVIIKGVEKLSSLFLIVGPSGSGKTNLMKNILEQVNFAIIIDSNQQGLFSFKKREGYIYVDNDEMLGELIDDLNNLINMRLEQGKKLLSEEKIESLNEYYDSTEELIICIDDIDDFIETYQQDHDLFNLINNSIKVNIKYIINIDSTGKKATPKLLKEDIFKILKLSKDGIILGQQSTFVLENLMTKEIPQLGYGVYIQNSEKTPIRIPKYKK